MDEACFGNRKHAFFIFKKELTSLFYNYRIKQQSDSIFIERVRIRWFEKLT